MTVKNKLLGRRNIFYFILVLFMSSINAEQSTMATISETDESTISSSLAMDLTTSLTDKDLITTTENPTIDEPDKGWYSVTGPKTFRPNSEYSCAVIVSLVESSEPTTVTVEIVGRQNSTIKYKTSQEVEVEPLTTKVVTLSIKDVVPLDYTLEVKGEGPLNFSNSTKLRLITKSTSMFIQTDRAAYKPGAKVQFRVLVLDSDMRPLNTSLQVYITDGEGNRIKDWKEVRPVMGVWSGELQLSDSPVLGDWNIHASARDNKISKNFEVAEYVLPKFEVSFNSPEAMLYKDGKIPIQISARYTYGGPVKGEVTVSTKPVYYNDKRITKVVPINGDATIVFDIAEDLNLNERWIRYLTFEASVEEALTGKIQNASGVVTLHHEEYKFDFIKESNYFKPGLKFNTTLRVTRFDGSPAINSNLKLNISLRYDYADKKENLTTYDVPSDGLLKLTFLPPLNVSNLDIRVSHHNRTEWPSHVSASKSPSNNFIQATLFTKDPKVNSDVEVALEMTEHCPIIFYEVMCRGRLILADNLPVNEGLTTAVIKFLASPSMAPTSKIIVYYFRQDKEIVADSIDLNLDQALHNFVKVISNTSEVQPGEGVQLRVEAEPNSYVGLLGVDQSSILLKKGNDLSKDVVENELRGTDGFSAYVFDDYYWSPFSTARSIFHDAKTFVLTNGLVYEHHEWPTYSAFGNKLGGPGIMFGAAVSLSAAVPDSFAFAAQAAPGAPSGGSSPLKPKLRSKFPETWIWQDVNVRDAGKVLLNKTMPDTITSWVISAFSLDSSHGLGLIDQPTKIKVFRPFFISLDLPYSIIRGETVTIPVLVFNYMDTEVTAEVTMLNNAGQFEFGDTTNSISDKPEKALFMREHVTVQPNSGERTSFTITPTELGHISIKVSAKSDIAADLVERKLLVKAEGETQYMNQAVFVDLRKDDSFEEDVSITIPDNFVEGSARVEVSAVGDILGTSLQNLEKLIRMPYGCGEQNMLNFVPNIVVLDYLKNSKQLSPSIEAKCLKYMETGYQRELTYKHRDGSFSAFGESDRSGSTWLTAFVLKSFASAKPHMDIDKKILEDGLKWLADKQAQNGSFPEVGTVSHKDMQGGSGQGTALTSFTLLAFLAYYKPGENNATDKGLDYIVKQLESIKNDSYSLAITTYVLHLADHPVKDTAFEMLQANAQKSRSMKWWKRAAKKTDSENPYSLMPNSVDVEMTAYAMLTYLARGMVEDSIPVMSWLMSQQNSDGGFASTQDTVVALSALSKMAEKIADTKPDVTVSFSTDGFSKDVTINSDNAIILQKILVPGKPDKVKIKAKGQGLSVVQVSYSYNIDVTGAFPMFNILPKITNNSETSQLLLDICSSFVSGSEGDGDESSNMVVMEISLPSGYTTDQDFLPTLRSSSGIKKVELKDGDTHIALYFDKMTKEEICPHIIASRSHKVEKSKPVPITVYDYYDQSRRARVFYSIPDGTCPDDSCKQPSTELPASV